jgi:TolB-like protein
MMEATLAQLSVALRCAAEVRREMALRNSGVALAQRMEFRIGINVGDVVVEDGDIFGDAVNVAARLEGLAEPGGICISGRVQEDVVGRLDLVFRDLGDQNLKNIARPVRVYAVDTTHVPKSGPGTSVPRLSIVVLPFVNLSDDRDQQYFADGVTEDLTTDLSRLADMFVISRSTAFSYQGKRVDAKQIGRELGVRYVLEGSVRRLGNRVRVNAQLIDAATNAHLWAERLDGDVSDLFALQDEVTSRIAVTLNIELVAAEAVRPTEHPDALDYVLRGRAVMFRGDTRDNRAESIELFERALALDPRSVEAQSWFSIGLSGRVMAGWANSVAVDLARAERLAREALAASPRSPLAHSANAQVLRAQRRFVEAIPEYEKVIASNRNWVGAFHGLAQCKLFAGLIDDVIPHEEEAIRLSPRDPNILFYSEIGFVHLLQSRIDDAILWLERARSANPEHAAPRARLAAAFGLKGEVERAVSELADARRLIGDEWYANLARLRGIGYWGVPPVRALVEATYFVGLRKAGMLEE